MQAASTAISGVFLLKPEPISDERGFFARLSCTDEFARLGISWCPKQMSLSRNTHVYTLRGMHYCMEPEAKLVRCGRGRILDVLFDIRRDSPTFGSCAGFELDAQSALSLYVPNGVAHGFLTLEPDCDVIYQMERIYRPGYDAGLRWNDPLFAFRWPAPPQVISARDASYPDFS